MKLTLNTLVAYANSMIKLNKKYEHSQYHPLSKNYIIKIQKVEIGLWYDPSLPDEIRKECDKIFIQYFRNDIKE